MRKLLRMQKIKHFILKNIFKILKYEFEAYIPNSAGKASLINKLIKINIKDTNRNLALISEQFTEMSIVNLDDLIVDEDIRKKLNDLFNLHQSDKNLHGYDKIYSSIFRCSPECQALFCILFDYCTNVSLLRVSHTTCYCSF